MAVRRDDPIIGPARGTPEELIAWGKRVGVARWPDFVDYAVMLWAMHEQTGVDPVIAAGQFSEETAKGNTLRRPDGRDWPGGRAWLERLNPASIWITSTGQPGEADVDHGLRWDSGSAAARAQLAHLYGYATGRTPTWSFTNPRVAIVLGDPDRAGMAPRLEDLGGLYAANTGYGGNVAARANEIFAGVPDAGTGGDGGNGMAEYNFDPARAPFPAMQRMIVQKSREGAGFDRVPFRGPRIVGTAEHMTAGHGTLSGYAIFFGKGGERDLDALVDVVIDQAGNACWLNDPYTVNEGGTRAGWASGGVDGLEGDGPAFIKALGIEAVNGRLIPKEHILVTGEEPSDAMILTSARFNAAVAQRSKVPWDAYPFNPNVGVVTDIWHSEFTGKGGNGIEECPGSRFKKATPRMQDITRGILKLAQAVGGGATTTPAPVTPVPPTKPVENPGHDAYPDGVDTYENARRMFGTGTQHRRDGTDHGFGFRLESAVSMAWLARGAQEKKWPKVDEWWELVNSNDTVRNVVTFQGGWTLLHLANRKGWHWGA